MKIKVLGTGCAKCNQLEKDVFNTLAELDIPAEVEKISDIQAIMAYKVMITPALVINDKVKAAGKALKKKDVEKYIKEEQE